MDFSLFIETNPYFFIFMPADHILEKASQSRILIVLQEQNMVSQFVRGMIRTTLLTFGSIFCMFRLNARFGLTALCAFPFLAGTLAFCLWKANPLFAKLQMELDQINDSMQKDISRGLASWKRIRELLGEPSDLSEGSMIRQMPQGYDTRLCGGGNNTSQGQR